MTKQDRSEEGQEPSRGSRRGRRPRRAPDGETETISQERQAAIQRALRRSEAETEPVPRPPSEINTADLEPADLDQAGQHLLHSQREMESRDASLRQARDQETASRERYRSFFDFAPLPYLLLDYAGQIRDANAAAGELLRTEASLLRAGLFLGFVAEPHRARYTRLLRAVLDGAERHEQDMELVLPGGDLAWVLASAMALPDGGEDERLCLMALADISRRHAVEDALLASERRYRSVIDNVGVGILMLSPSMEVESINRRMQDWFPMLREGKSGSCFQAIHGPGRAGPCTDCPSARAFADGRPHEATMEAATRQGTRVFRFLASPIKDAAGRVTGVIEVVEDETDRAQMEAARLERERMAAVGTLASGMAHEFNNAMAGITGYLELLECDQRFDDKTRARFAHMQRAAERVVTTTRNLLAMTQQEAYHKRYALLDPVARASVALLRADFEAAGVDLQVEWGRTPLILMDAEEVAKVVRHLLTNALHAVLAAPTKRVRLDTGILGDRVVLRVRDSGCGIPASARERAFLPFFSLKGEHAPPDSPLAKVKGAGLGLAVCQRIVHNHGGALELTPNEDGVGITSTLLLPLWSASRDATPKLDLPETPAEEGEPTAPARAATATVGRLLVLEDEPDQRHLLEMVLGKAGHEVFATDDGFAALAQARESRAEVALIDLQMPIMSGAEFMRRLRELPEAQRPVVVVVTGKMKDTNLLTIRRPEVFKVISKPFNLRALMETVNEALAARRAQA